jgi:hypothetical protein
MMPIWVVISLSTYFMSCQQVQVRGGSKFSRELEYLRVAVYLHRLMSRVFVIGEPEIIKEVYAPGIAIFVKRITRICGANGG